MEAFELEAQLRKTTGSAESRRLRRQGRVPAIMYGGKDKQPVMLSIAHNELARRLDNEAFYSHIIKIRVDDKTQEAVLRDLQRHPARPFIEHVDFMRVTADEVLRMNVPLHFVGEEECPGVVEDEGILQRNRVEVEIECLPRDLPQYIEVDVSQMRLNDVIHLRDLTLPEGVELVELMYAEEEDLFSVASVQIPRVEEEPEEDEEAIVAEGEEEAAESAAGEEAEDDAEAQDE